MTEIRVASLADMAYIEHLRRSESEAIGFIPLLGYEMEIDGRRGGDIYLAWDNGQPTGFIYATHNRAGVTHVQQVVVQEDARRAERASLLVEAVTRERDWLVSLRCAAGLDATTFWQALGFDLHDRVEPKSVYGRGKDKATLPTRRRREILRFQKVVGGLWLPTIGDAR
jgi:GNAT superfamily N-acetyltransferase